MTSAINWEQAIEETKTGWDFVRAALVDAEKMEGAPLSIALVVVYNNDAADYAAAWFHGNRWALAAALQVEAERMRRVLAGEDSNGDFEV